MGRNITRGLVGHWITGDGSLLSNFGAYDPAIMIGGKLARGEKGIVYRNKDDQYIKINNSPSSDMSDAEGITLSCWVKLRNLVNTYPVFLGKGVKYRIGLNGSDQRIYWRIRANSADIITISTETINLNEWTHVVGRAKDGDTSIFINGVKSVATQPYSLPFENDANDIYIGAYVTATGSSVGDFFDCRLYSKGLTDKEIYQLYSYGLNKVPTTKTIQ